MICFVTRCCRVGSYQRFEGNATSIFRKELFSTIRTDAAGVPMKLL
jgi:hypothetical protein